MPIDGIEIRGEGPASVEANEAGGAADTVKVGACSG